MGGLYQDYTVQSWEVPKQEFGFPQNQFWKYSQMRHLLANTFGCPSVVSSKVDTLEITLKVFLCGPEASAHHAMILEDSGSSVFSLDLWQSFSEMWNKMSRELRTRLIQFKCWRRCEKDDTLIHTLWSCPKIHSNQAIKKISVLHAEAVPSGAMWDQNFAQGHFNILTAGVRNQTTNPPNRGQPAPPTEPPRNWFKHCEKLFISTTTEIRQKLQCGFHPMTSSQPWLEQVATFHLAC